MVKSAHFNGAYEHAKSFTKRLNMSAVLQRNKAYELIDLCSHKRYHFRRTTNTVDLSTLNSDDDITDDTGYADDEDDHTRSEQVQADFDKEDDHLDNDDENHQGYLDKQFSNMQRENFGGMRIYDTNR